MIDLDRFNRLVAAASTGLKERDEIIANALLAILSGQSVFFFGPPGTAKSLIARRLAGVFKSSMFFECLMNRFTTPEEMFGPVSIKELKSADRYVRKTDGFLPSADFAFLDEIWKSSPAILNALLTILNERKFRNGDKVEDVPLKAVVAASNEIPQSGQGLEALYDRFIMRFNVPPVSSRDSFESLLGGVGVGANVEIAEEDKITNDEWTAIQKAIADVRMSREVLDVIHAIRVKLDEHNSAENASQIYVSDRRWIKAVAVAKTGAAVCGRTEVIPADLLLIGDCIWSRIEDREVVSNIVAESVAEFGVTGVSKLMDWQKRFDAFESKVLKRDFWDREASNTVTIGNVECYPIPSGRLKGMDGPHRNLYIPISMGCAAGKKFHPLTANGVEYPRVTCISRQDGAFDLKVSDENAGHWWEMQSFDGGEFSVFVPEMNVHAGDDKDISRKTLAADMKKAQEYSSGLDEIAHELKTQDGVGGTALPQFEERFRDLTAGKMSGCTQSVADSKIRVDHLLFKLQRHKSWKL